MKITATSTFHGEGMSVKFSGCTEGINIRKLRGPRSKYCLDYSNSNSHVCGCGFPINHTSWDAPEGFGVENLKNECGPNGEEYGKGYVCFTVFDANSRKA